MVCKSQTSAWGGLQESLKDLHDLDDLLRVHGQRLRIQKVIGERSIVEDYRQGNLSLILDVVADAHRDIPWWLLQGAPGTPVSLDFTSLILCFNAIKRSVVNSREQEAVFISDVEAMDRPDGKIPSFVRLYLGRDDPEKVSTGRVYFSPMKRRLELIRGLINWELGERADCLGGNPLNGFEPRIIESALQIVNSVPEHQCDVSKGFPVSEVMLNDFIPGLWIDLHRSYVGVWQNAHSCVNIRNVLIGPFDLEARRFKAHCSR